MWVDHCSTTLLQVGVRGLNRWQNGTQFATEKMKSIPAEISSEMLLRCRVALQISPSASCK